MKIYSLSESQQYIEEIAGWYHREWFDGDTAVTKDEISRSIKKKVDFQCSFSGFYVAVDADSLVGVVEFKFRENISYPEYVHWLGGLYVKHENRGEGIASELLSLAKNHAVKQGVAKLYLQCETNLISLYEKHGFRVLHRRDY